MEQKDNSAGQRRRWERRHEEGTARNETAEKLNEISGRNIKAEQDPLVE